MKYRSDRCCSRISVDTKTVFQEVSNQKKRDSVAVDGGCTASNRTGSWYSHRGDACADRFSIQLIRAVDDLPGSLVHMFPFLSLAVPFPEFVGRFILVISSVRLDVVPRHGWDLGSTVSPVVVDKGWLVAVAGRRGSRLMVVVRASVGVPPRCLSCWGRHVLRLMRRGVAPDAAGVVVRTRSVG